MKYGISEQDEEDYEQEKLIKEWADKNDIRGLEYEYINSKGGARNSLVRASFSLDQEIGEDGGGTFADIIAGCDGRDLECREEFDDTTRDLDQEISWYLFALGFNQEGVVWLKKIFQKSMRNKKMLL